MISPRRSHEQIKSTASASPTIRSALARSSRKGTARGPIVASKRFARGVHHALRAGGASS